MSAVESIFKNVTFAFSRSLQRWVERTSHERVSTAYVSFIPDDCIYPRPFAYQQGKTNVWGARSNPELASA